MKILGIFTLLTVLMLTCTTLQAQNASVQAYFANTEETVYRDSKDRLVMSYQITGLSSQSEADALSFLFMQHNLFEKFEIKPTSDPNVWDVFEITRPAIKVKDHRKVFIVAGIVTVFVDNEPFPVDGFRIKMLKNKN